MATIKRLCLRGAPLRNYRIIGSVRYGSDVAKGEKPFYPDYVYGEDACPKFDFIEEIKNAPRMTDSYPYGEPMFASVLPSRVCHHMVTFFLRAHFLGELKKIGGGKKSNS